MISSKVMRLAIFLAVLTCARAEFKITREVDEVIYQTFVLTNTRELFPMRDLKLLEEDAGEYLNVGRHVGNLIAAAADVEFEEGSEEQNALHALHSELLEQIKEAGSYFYRNAYLRKIETGYLWTLAYPLRELREKFGSMTNRNLTDRAKTKDEFMSMCAANITNHGMLDYLDRVFRSECPLITEEDVSRLIRIKDAFRHFENRNKINTCQREPWQYKASKKRIMTNIGELTMQQANNLISVLESTTFSFMQRLFYSVHRNFEDFATSGIFNELRSVKSGCIPEVMYHAAEETREAISAAVQQLKLDLVVIVAMTAACTNISTGGDEKRMKAIFTEAHNKTQKIVAHMKTWIDQLYVHTVPRVANEVAKRYIENKEFRNETEYAELERQVWIAFRAREPAGKFLYILTAPTSDMGKWWSVQALRDGLYTNLTEYNEVDVHVFRYDDPFRYYHDREMNLIKWMDENRDILRDILRSHLHSSATDVMQALNDATNGTLCSNDRYHSVFLIGGTSKDGEDLLMGKSEPLFFARIATQCVEYSENGRHWKLFLFV